MKVDVDSGRLSNEIDELAAISDAEAPAVTRIVFTPTDLKARAWLIGRCEDAGLAVRQDPDRKYLRAVGGVGSNCCRNRHWLSHRRNPERREIRRRGWRARWP